MLFKILNKTYNQYSGRFTVIVFFLDFNFLTFQ